MNLPLPAIQQAVREGRLIDAIKLYREATGVGLAEAKQAIDRMVVGEAATTGVPKADGSVEEALAAGNKIEAVKRYRDQHGVGLREAKDAVERMEAGHVSVSPAAGVPSSETPVKPSGCFAMLAGLLVVGSALVVWAFRAA